MAQIGGVGCTFVRGHCPAKKMRLALWQVPGIDGFGAQRMGYGDSHFQVVAVLYSNAIGLQLWKQSLENLQGTIVSITNDLGITSAGCLIAHVGPLQSMAARAPGGITHRGEIIIEGVVV